MEKLYFEDFVDLACDIVDKYDALNSIEEYRDIAIIAKYEEARQIIKELMCIGYDLHSIVMHYVEYDGYEFEYIISLYDDEIWVEPMMRDSGYITDDSPIMYVLDNCSSKVIPYCKGKRVYEVSLGICDEDSCEPMCGSECCGCCDCDCDENESYPHEVDYEDDKSDNMHGFNVNKSDDNGYYSYSFYSTDKNLVEQIAKMFGR